MPIDEPILIVGAGPVGLTAALWLTRYGLPVRIVDQKEQGSKYSKALGLHAPTLEMLERLDVAEPFLKAGRPVRRIQMFSEDGRSLAEFEFDEIDSPHNYVFILEQAQTERLLREELEEHGVEVEWGSRLTSTTQAEKCVAMFADGTASSHPFILGCDGGPSTVREELEIPFEGEKTPTWFVLADARVDWDQEPGEVRAFLGKAGPLLFIPLPEIPRYRLVTPLLDANPETQPDLSEDRFRQLVAERCPFDAELSEFAWQSSFQVRRRLAKRYRRDGIFLLGDAAHSHSPIGGQGMNTGLADAANLCWKLDAVINGGSSDELLDTYESERRPVAEEILNNTQFATQMATADSGFVQDLRNRIVQVASSFRAVRGEAARRASMTEFVYSGPQFGHAPARIADTELMTHEETEHPSVAQRVQFARAPHPGARAPDVQVSPDQRLLASAGIRQTLLLFDGLGATREGYDRFHRGCERLRGEFDDRLHFIVVTPVDEVPTALSEAATIVHDPDLAAHQRYGAKSEAGYLIRPDSYIAWRGQPMDFDALADFLGL